MNTESWFDSHCHLSDPLLKDHLVQDIEFAISVGIKHFVSSALCASEFHWHSNFKNRYPQFAQLISWCAGIHPYYQLSSENDLKLLDQLIRESKIIAIGEIGLDKRNPDLNYQKKILLEQLYLASSAELPVFLHIVKYYYEIFSLLRKNFPDLTYIIHGFNSSLETAKEFSRLNSYFSLNSRLSAEQTLKYLIDQKRILLETDSPYASPDPDKPYNSLSNLLLTAERIAELAEISFKDLRKIQAENFLKLFGNKCSEDLDTT
ncbi:MAG: TatD family hydrolase [Candidatus Cloacimonetes bacterium]|nr:TatD family hydrolase [Candidatus Cloacimonadota bacterium]